MKRDIIKYAIAIAIIAISTLSINAEREYEPLCKERRTWIYSQYYNSRPQKLHHKVFTIKGTSEINGYTYHNCYAYDYDNPEKTLVLAAFLRENNGKVYMTRLGAERNLDELTLGEYNGYNYWLDETLIYDFSLTEGEEFQVGKDENYGVYCRYPYLLDMVAKRGKIRCVETYEIADVDNCRKHLKLEFADKTSPRYHWLEEDQFICAEGIGLLSHSLFGTDNSGEPGLSVMGYMPFPYTAEMSMDWPFYIDLLYVCDDGDFNKVIYHQEGRPATPKEYFDTLAVDEIHADEDAAPVYFNIQGMPVSNPTEGEIYIVKRGSKATKEVYRR